MIQRTHIQDNKLVMAAMCVLLFTSIAFGMGAFNLSYIGINTIFPYYKVAALVNIFLFMTYRNKVKKRDARYLLMPLLGFVIAELVFSFFALYVTYSLLSAANDFILLYFFASLFLKIDLTENEVTSVYLFARRLLTFFAVVMIMEFIFETNFYITLMPSFLQGGDQYARAGFQERLGRIRAVGPFAQGIGASLWMGTNFGLYLFLPAKNPILRVCGMVVSLIAILCTLSRVGIIATIVLSSLFIPLYLYHKKRQWTTTLASISGLVLVVLFILAIPELRALTLGSISEDLLPPEFEEQKGYTLEYGALETRNAQMFEIFTYYFDEYPFEMFGAGILRYNEKVIPPKAYREGGYITNLYAVLLLEIGLPAVLFYLFFMYRASKLLLGKINSRTDAQTNQYLTALWIFGIYALSTLSIQAMPTPTLLLLTCLPITVNNKSIGSATSEARALLGTALSA